jgi:DNA polymerase I-like protein with 3'-5' exonuclease and polymerase domains
MSVLPLAERGLGLFKVLYPPRENAVTITIDLETEAIKGNPIVYPPKPVGVAIKYGDRPGKYLSWGHPTGNNTTFEEARKVLGTAVMLPDSLLFHNAGFDQSVMLKHMGVAVADPLRVRDTMYSIFLSDPYAANMGLKPSAERILDWPPDEQDKLRDWILANVKGSTKKNFGAFISLAPADLVGPYAIGDVDRTYGLDRHIEVPLGPYEREQKLLPILTRATRRGIPIDVDLLSADLIMYESTLQRVEAGLRKSLRDDNVSFDSGEELADALEKAGLVSQWTLTPTGKRSTAREALDSSIADSEFREALQYRNALAHCMANFMRPWMGFAGSTGLLHPEWNSVRQPRDDKKSKGARTGRLASAAPGFMNVPNEYELNIPQGLPDLPIMRKYVTPHPGRVWIKRDYSQQELRILAHFTEGKLFDRYLEDPTIDAHDETRVLVKNKTGKDFSRRPIKITGFSVVYGSGIGGLARQLKVSAAEAMSVREAYFLALPEVRKLMKSCTRRGRDGIGVTTWGGRHYFAEPPKTVKGKHMTFEYKLLNYLIQGSAADCTKEAIIRHDSDRGDGELLVTVHDELDGDAPEGNWRPAMHKLKEAMESIEFDVKMLSDGFVGPTWSALEAVSE